MSAFALDALFLSPHPDDVDIFCGASVATLAARGRAVAIVDLSAGELASNGTPEGRRADSLRAAAALGLGEERGVLGLQAIQKDVGSEIDTTRHQAQEFGLVLLADRHYSDGRL